MDLSDEIKIDEIKIDEMKIDEIKINEIKINEIKINEIKINEKRFEFMINFLDKLFKNSIDSIILENIAKYNHNIYYYVALMCDIKRKFTPNINRITIKLYRKALTYIKCELLEDKTNDNINENMNDKMSENMIDKTIDKTIEYEKRNICIYNLADLLETIGEFDEAKTLANELLRYDYDAHFILGSIASKEGHLDKAIEYLEKGIELGSKRGFKSLVNLYYRINDIEKAFNFCLFQAKHNEDETLKKWFNTKIIELIEKRSIIGRITKDEYREIYEAADISTLPLSIQYNVGDSFYEGKCVHRDRKEAEKIFQRLSYDYNDCDSQHMLAEIFRLDYYNNDEMKKRAHDMYVKSAHNGSYASCKYLLKQLKNNINNNYDEYDKLLKKAMSVINNPDQKNINLLSHLSTIEVNVVYLNKLLEHLQKVEAKLMEYELRPPIHGGQLYREAHDDFYKNIAIISFSKNYI